MKWEMIGFGPGYLRFRRQEDPSLWEAWEYHRISGVMLASTRREKEAEGWTYCGSWGVFHYFKRPALDS